MPRSKRRMAPSRAAKGSRQQATADYAARFLALSAAIGAEAFAVIAVSAVGNACTLEPLFDADHPRTARATRRLVQAAPPGHANRLLTSSRPFWWRRDLLSQPFVLRLADEENVFGDAGDGLALPLHAGLGRNGLAVFTGAGIVVDDERLAALHLQANALFSSWIALIRGLVDGGPTMTVRKLECLRLSADGNTSEAIAERLGLSVHTTTQYLTAAAQKLDAVNRAHAVAKALRLGLIA